MFKKLNDVFADSIRDPFPDFLRGIALILMIQVHLTELILIKTPDYLFFEKVSYFLGGIPAAPVFLILMGYFQGLAKGSLKREIVRGVKLILLGLILNFLMNFTLIYKILFGEIIVNPWHYIFGVDILFVAGLSYIFLSFVKRFLNKIQLQVVLIVLIFVIQYLLKDLRVKENFFSYLLAFVLRVTDWSYFPIIPWLAFPLMGLILSHNRMIKHFQEIKLPRWLLLTLSIFLLAFIKSAVEISTTLNLYYNFDGLFFLWSLAFLLMWGYLLKNIQFKFGESLLIKYVRWLGKNVTVVYFVQWILIGNIGTQLYQSISFQNYVIIFALILFVTSICTYLFTLSRL